MSEKKEALKAPKKVEKASDSSVEAAFEVNEAAAKELAGAVAEAEVDKAAEKKHEDGTSGRVEALEAFIEGEKEEDEPLFVGLAAEREALDKQEKEVAARLKAIAEKVEKENESQADKDSEAIKADVDKKFEAAKKSNQ